MCCVQQRSVELYPPGLPVFGLSLFFIGQAGNFYHHILLSRMRSAKSEDNYVVPTGGLFDSLGETEEREYRTNMPTTHN